jgi:uncharacterized protein (UPF0332 family)
MKSGELFNKAKTALESAKLLLDAGDFDGACNRAYYAMFDAARGALIISGLIEDLTHIRTHTGLITNFSLHLVKTGKVSIELGKALNKVEGLRLMADYKDDPVSFEDAKWAFEQAEHFLTAIQASFKLD